ncbi:MAG: 3-phosphoshikimate 1-carboxyvinyltransferase [Candidatus Micrarchaeia archaeon]
MKAIITPSKISGSTEAPPSKSFTHRAVLIASLADGKSVIENPLICDDTMHTIRLCGVLGARISSHDNILEVTGCGGRPRPNKHRRGIGDSRPATTEDAAAIRLRRGAWIRKMAWMRFFGEGRPNQSSDQDFIDALNIGGLKVRVHGQDQTSDGAGANNVPVEELEGGYLPLEIEDGELKGGDIEVFGGKSSQFISSLLMIAPYAKHDTRIIVKGGLVSAPYVDMTIQVMEDFGVEVLRPREDSKYKEFVIPCGQRYKPRRYKIEGDWSAASYFFAAAAICGGKVEVTRLNPLSRQGDKIFPYLLSLMKHNVIWYNSGAEINGRDSSGISLSMHAWPDIVHALSAVAAFARGVTNISGIGHLRTKEADRIAEIRNELLKFGINAEATENSLCVCGLSEAKPKGAEIDSHGDHRLAMAFTAAALGAEGRTVINNIECVLKSYPDFFRDMRKLGADIELVEEKA